MRRAVILVFVFFALFTGGTRARGVLLTVCDTGCSYTNTQLQAAILDAMPGDEILLQGGHTYTGTYKLPSAKGCAANDDSCYITIRTGVTADGALMPDSAFPPRDVRIGPSAATMLARLQSSTVNAAVIRTVEPGEVGSLCGAAPCVARWWRLSRLEVLPEATYQGGALIELGSNDTAASVPNGDTQDRRSEIPSHFVLEQIYAHGDPVLGQFRGLYLHADDVTVKDSYVSDIKSRTEGQAITITNCAGPIRIVNNHLEGNAENLLSGGDGARVMQSQTVLASPTPTVSSARLSATTDLQVGQWISVIAGGIKQSTIVRTISDTDVTFDPIGGAPDVPGGVRWGLVPGGLVFTRNHVYKPPSWRNPIVPTPTSPAAVAVPGAGSLAAGTYGYRVVARLRTSQNQQAYSAATPEVAASLASAGAITVTWGNVPNAQAYIVYGRTPSAQNQSWTVGSSVTTFTDAGSAGTSGSIPAVSYWLVKNNFELKAMDGALIEGNVFDYSWSGGQTGYLVLLTVANTGGGNDSTVVRDITFRNNRVRHGAGALQLTSQDVSTCACQVSGRLENVAFKNNVFEDIGTAWGPAVPAIAISGPGTATEPKLGPRNLSVEHNTLVTSGTNKFLNLTLGRNSIDYKVENFTFANNMARRSTYGLRYDKSPGGMQAEGLTSWALGTNGTSLFTRNVIADASCSIYPDPANNFCPSSAEWQAEFANYAGGDFHLRAGSPYQGAGTDGQDLGADIAAVDALTGIALSGDNRSAVAPPPPVAVTTTSTPGGQVGIAYDAILQASGGVAPYTWVSSGQLPPGLSLSAGGTLSGTPTTAGTFVWIAIVTDSGGATASATLSTAIAPAPPPPLAITTTSTPNGQVGVAYSAALAASGGVPPYAWSASGQVPPGLALSTGGVVSGTPTTAGTFAWTAIVTDSAGTVASAALATTIAPAPPPAVPAAPTSLRVVSVTKNQVLLSWIDNSTDETGFEIERSIDAVLFKTVGSVGASVTSFTSTGLRSGRTYYFRVRAVGLGGASPYSNVVSATTTARTGS